MNINNETPTRLDTWLWAARFFKTRPLAKAAVQNHRVLINGNKAKPGSHLSPGMVLEIQTPANRFTVEVTALSRKRLSAALAQGLYLESQTSILARQEQAKILKEGNLGGIQAPKKKPDKRERAQLRALKKSNSN